ncbi:MAG: type II secretion system protein [Planctomycetota bacterium]|jgi:prepilin-type N-terminal cleavage/methylation domain-containing protein
MAIFNNRCNGFTLVELLIVIAIITLLASMTFVGIIIALDRAKQYACMHNLKELGLIASLYSDDNSSNIFPWAGEDATACDHLNILASYDGRILPRFFICPASSGKIKASRDEDGLFALTGRSCSYAYAREPLSREDDPMEILLADAEMRGGEKGSGNNHKSGICVYRVGCSTEFVRTRKLPDGLVIP